MPIQIDKISDAHPFVFNGWTVTDLEAVANIIAHVLLGRARHARSILEGLDAPPPLYSSENIDEAIKRVNFPGVDPTDNRVIHRDGWLFQMLSWLTSVKECPDALIKAPQPRPADKGFDGLLINLDGSQIESVLICEDKATDNPRHTVQQDVWPEFTGHENGRRDNELVSDAVALLIQKPDIDVDDLTRSSKWFHEKRYRASVATSHDSLPARISPFDDYETIVTGDNRRRHANLFLHPNMRGFFEELSLCIVTRLEALRPA